SIAVAGTAGCVERTGGAGDRDRRAGDAAGRVGLLGGGRRGHQDPLLARPLDLRPEAAQAGDPGVVLRVNVGGRGEVAVAHVYRPVGADRRDDAYVVGE